MEDLNLFSESAYFPTKQIAINTCLSSLSTKISQSPNLTEDCLLVVETAFSGRNEQIPEGDISCYQQQPINYRAQEEILFAPRPSAFKKVTFDSSNEVRSLPAPKILSKSADIEVPACFSSKSFSARQDFLSIFEVPCFVPKTKQAENPASEPSRLLSYSSIYSNFQLGKRDPGNSTANSISAFQFGNSKDSENPFTSLLRDTDPNSERETYRQLFEKICIDSFKEHQWPLYRLKKREFPSEVHNKLEILTYDLFTEQSIQLCLQGKCQSLELKKKEKSEPFLKKVQSELNNLVVKLLTKWDTEKDSPDCCIEKGSKLYSLIERVTNSKDLNNKMPQLQRKKIIVKLIKEKKVLMDLTMSENILNKMIESLEDLTMRNLRANIFSKFSNLKEKLEKPAQQQMRPYFPGQNYAALYYFVRYHIKRFKQYQPKLKKFLDTIDDKMREVVGVGNYSRFEKKIVMYQDIRVKCT